MNPVASSPVLWIPTAAKHILDLGATVSAVTLVTFDTVENAVTVSTWA